MKALSPAVGCSPGFHLGRQQAWMLTFVSMTVRASA
jgi:hypothetical protein